MIRDSLGATCASFMTSTGTLPTFAKLPGAEAATLSLTEMLLRLIPKRPAIEALANSLHPRDGDQESPRFTLHVAALLAVDLVGAPSFQLSSNQLSEGPRRTRQDSLVNSDSQGGSSSSSSSNSSSSAYGALAPEDMKVFMHEQKSLSFIHHLLLRLRELHLVDEAVRGGGLGPLLAHRLRTMLALAEDETVTLLLLVSSLLADERTQGLAIALVKDGLLEAAAQHCRHFVAAGQPFVWVPLFTVFLLRAVCWVLDNNASSGLLTSFPALLGDVPPLHCAGITADVFASLASGSPHPPPVVIPPGTWVAKFSTEKAWKLVCDQLLPALSAACEAVISGSQSQQQDGIFRDVAVSAWTCCSPGCTNLAGQQEASVVMSNALPTVSSGLAAAVEELSYWLKCFSDGTSLDKTLLAAAGGSQLAVDLQDIFCSGSLLTRLCSRAAVEQHPAAVAAFLQGLTAVVEALPSAAVDYATFREAAGYIDAALALAERHGNNKAGELYMKDPPPGIPAGLAATVETLSYGLTRQGFLKALQTAPAGGPVAAALQRLYCRGSLMNRFCNNGAVTQTPAAVAGFLVGLRDMLGAFPEATVEL
ncbi:hypothetical protein N2152v2_002708 [Parachlorella kessleri]